MVGPPLCFDPFAPRLESVARLAGLDRLPLPLARSLPLLARDVLLRPRVEAADFERDEAFVERPEALFGFGLEPLDELPLALLRGLREADLLLAMRDPLPQSGISLALARRYPLPA